MDITFEYDSHFQRDAYVIRDAHGAYVGGASSREGAERMRLCIARFGHFDPTEPRQRDAMRELDD